jgi:hypothetical protein
MYEKSLEVVAAQEPWRQRIGHPEAVDDPMWSAADAELCTGVVSYEGRGSKHWVCNTCGYIGWSSLPAHRAPQNPQDMLQSSRAYFVEARQNLPQQQFPVFSDQAELQADFIAAVALRTAAKKSPAELRDFIERMTRL